jgi:Ca-activated chloride channel family protein
MYKFEYPWVLLLIILVFICLFFCKEKRYGIYFPTADIFKNIVGGKQIFISVLKFLIPSLIIISLASPIKTGELLFDKNNGYEIALVLDASGSMERGNKFGIVKEIVADFIDKRQNDKLALNIFADFAYSVVPMTYDKKSLKILLKNINLGIAGRRNTALYEALFSVANLFKTSKAKEKIAILLTDGKNSVENIPLDEAIKNVKRYGIKVYTIGVGNGRSVNMNILQEIAKATGGKSFLADSKNTIKEVYKQINNLEKSEINAEKYAQKTYFFAYPLFLALFLSLLYFWRKN